MKSLFTERAGKVGPLPFALLAGLIFFQLHISAVGQTTSRIPYNSKDVFLNGINVAWVNFAGDLGPNLADTTQFKIIFQQVRNSGGNALRFWLNTNGVNTPSYNSQGMVTGPGAVAISNLKRILSLAHRYRVGLLLSLWSHDMLNTSELNTSELNRNDSLLMDTTYTMAYIRNALIPMVDSVKDSPAVIGWEIFNEPEGISNEFGWGGRRHVPMADIQRCVNLMAGAIHTADPEALVTSAANSFQTLTDVNPVASTRFQRLEQVESLSQSQLEYQASAFNALHRTDFTATTYFGYLKKIAAAANMNYYSNSQLIAAGGDTAGTLNFYEVHYYSADGTGYDPFTHAASYWQLSKPTIVGEFYMTSTGGVPATSLYQTLYQEGYAGGLDWSWTDFPVTPLNPNAASDTWKSLLAMWNNHRQSVDVFGADWPVIAMLNPTNHGAYPDSTQMTLTAAVVDTGATVSSVAFFSSDSLLGKVTVPSDTSADTLFYVLQMKNIVPGNFSVFAVATNSQGQEGNTDVVAFSAGKPPMTRLSASLAAVHGSSISLVSDGSAPTGHYLDIKTNDTTATVTWQFTNQLAAGTYPVSFGFKLQYASPKTQFINVNGVRADTVIFEGSTSAWLDKTIEIHLQPGENTVQVQMSWGWMYLSYLGVPTDVVTSVVSERNVPSAFSLEQNYPNPFNPSTKIEFTLPSAQQVTLVVYDVLGQKVRELIDRKMAPGAHVVDFNGAKLSSGVYFYRLTAGHYVSTKKMLLLK